MGSSIFIQNGTIVTNDKLQRIIYDGAIAIENDKIVSIGKTKDLTKDKLAPTTTPVGEKIL